MRHNQTVKIYLSALAAIAGIATAGASMLSDGYYASSSVLESGRWVKIRVTQTGMQQITFEQLQSWGFSDPSRVCVYGYGGTTLTSDGISVTQPDDLPQQPAIVHGDKLVFYGESNYCIRILGVAAVDIARNHYSDGGYYLLSDKGTPKEPEQVKMRNLSSSAPRIDSHFAIRYSERDVTNPGKAGAYFFDTLITPENPTYTYDLDMSDLYKCSDNPRWHVDFAVKGEINNTFDFNGNSQITSKISRGTNDDNDYYYYWVRRQHELTNVEPTGHYVITQTIDEGSAFSYVGIDNSWLIYPRKSRLGDDAQRLLYYCDMPVSSLYLLNDATRDTQIWDVSNGTRPKRLGSKFNSTDNSYSFTTSYYYSTDYNDPARIAVFDPERTLYSVEYAGIVGNSNIHGTATPQMVIVTTENCREQAERLAELHRTYQDMDVLVVGQDEVFNEFSSGTPDAMAVRRMCKMFYDRDRKRLRYLLLFGAGSYDNVGLEHPYRQTRDLLITYPARETEYAGSGTSSYTTDSFFGMLGDKTLSPVITTPMTIAVGRIPALSADEATRAVDKIERYLSASPDPELGLHALLLADDGNNNTHVTQQNEIAGHITATNSAVTVRRVFDNIYPIDSKTRMAYQAREAIVESLNEGVGFFSYAGHGHSSAFTHSDMWTRLLALTTDYDNEPFAMLATCDSYGFDRLDNNIAQNMLFKNPGGVIAMVAAGRTVFRDNNHTLSQRVTEEYFGRNNITMGEAFKNAYNTIMATEGSGLQLIYNTACYNYGGDPALPIHRYDYRAGITEVNGTAPAADAKATLTPLTFNHVSGAIYSGLGSIVSDYNGSATITVYDAPRTLRTLKQGDGQSDGDELIDIEHDEYVLARVRVPVNSGRFEADIYLPIPRLADKTNRITVSASDYNASHLACGDTGDVIVREYDASLAEQGTAPAINKMYIDTEDFTDGDITDSYLTLYATVDPGTSGINGMTTTIIPAVSVSLDRSRTFSNAATCLSYNIDGTLSLKLPVNDLSDGHHTLTLTVNSNDGQSVSDEVNFTVLTQTPGMRLDVAETVATHSATLTLEHTMSQVPAGRIIVLDADGNTVFSHAGCTFPYIWDLKDNAGNDLPEGVYRACAIVHGGNRYASTPYTDINILR